MTKYLRISSYTALGSPSSYMTLQLLHSEFFLYMMENYIFFLNSVANKVIIGGSRARVVRSWWCSLFVY
jgi:hypothetical protein